MKAPLFTEPFTIESFLQYLENLPAWPEPLDNAERIILKSATNGHVVRRYEFDQWADMNDTTDNFIVDMYIFMICFYVNRQKGLIRPGFEYTAPPDVYYEPCTFYSLILNSPGGHILAAIELQHKGIDRECFRQIQYFFLPMAVRAHWSLVVISPVDRTVEILDSTSSRHQNWRHRANNVYSKVFEFVQYMLGSDFDPNQWRTMDDQAPQQALGDTHNCGYFVCRYAMLIACREPLNPQSLQENLREERYRIAAELLHGNFHGQFDTHPIHPHPGAANRRANAPWQPLDQELLRTPRRDSVKPMTRTELMGNCVKLAVERGGRWVLGYETWNENSNNRASLRRAIEAHFDTIYRGTFVP